MEGDVTDKIVFEDRAFYTLFQCDIIFLKLYYIV